MSDDIVARLESLDVFADTPQKVHDTIDDAVAEIRRLRDLVPYWIDGARHHAARAVTIDQTAARSRRNGDTDGDENETRQEEHPHDR
jgi:hypothetical protein